MSSAQTEEELVPCCGLQVPKKVASIGEYVKLFIASGVVTVLVLVVFAGIALEYAILELPPIANFILLFFALTLLAYVEALHYSVIAIERWDMEKYVDKYPRAVACWRLCNTPETVQKFIVGRQFYVIFVVFLIAQITSFPHIPEDFAGLPPTLVLVLLQTGLPGIAIVLTYGQLISQLFVEEFTLQFMNLYGCNFCIRLALFAEFIGIPNFSWLLFHGSSRLFCHKVRVAKKIMKERKSSEALMQLEESSKAAEAAKAKAVEDGTAGNAEETLEDQNDPNNIERGAHFAVDEYNGKQQLKWFDYLRYLWSSVATLGSLGIILWGISEKAYVLPVDVPGAYIIAILMMINLFYLEGLMIAIVGTQYWDPETFRHAYPRAYKVHKLVNKPDNVKRFIIGRQFFTVLTNFLLAQIFTFANFHNLGWHPALFYVVVESGLVGVLTVLAFSQLLPELLAAKYPLRFMDLYYSYSTVAISLFLDFLGVGHCAWAIYFSSQYLFCKPHAPTDEEKKAAAELALKPVYLRVESAEILAADLEIANGTRKSSFSFPSGSSPSPTPETPTSPQQDASVGLDLQNVDVKTI